MAGTPASLEPQSNVSATSGWFVGRLLHWVPMSEGGTGSGPLGAVVVVEDARVEDGTDAAGCSDERKGAAQRTSGRWPSSAIERGARTSAGPGATMGAQHGPTGHDDPTGARPPTPHRMSFIPHHRTLTQHGDDR